MTTARAFMKGLRWFAAIFASALLDAEVLTLQQAIQNSEANNRAIRTAELERSKAKDEVDIARSYRLPVFSLTALGSQSLAHLGLTFPLGSLGVYPSIGPVPGKTTTLAGALQPGGIFYASVAQPLSQQHRLVLASSLPVWESRSLTREFARSDSRPLTRSAGFITESCKARAPREVCGQPSNFCGSSTRIRATTWFSGLRWRRIFWM